MKCLMLDVGPGNYLPRMFLKGFAQMVSYRVEYGKVNKYYRIQYIGTCSIEVMLNGN